MNEKLVAYANVLLLVAFAQAVEIKRLTVLLEEAPDALLKSAGVIDDLAHALVGNTNVYDGERYG